MSEQSHYREPLPSGYSESVSLPEPVNFRPDQLPWLKEPVDLQVAKCRLRGGEVFYLASAVGTHPDLVKAAEGMTEGQKQNVDNMFYSRLPEYIQRGHSPGIETMADAVTEVTMKVMKNKGGQRLYFCRFDMPGTENQPDREGPSPLIVRVGVCDKNRQGIALSVLSSLSPQARKRRIKRGT